MAVPSHVRVWYDGRESLALCVVRGVMCRLTWRTIDGTRDCVTIPLSVVEQALAAGMAVTI